MIKLLPFLFIALPITTVAQSKQQLIAQAKYYHKPASGLERTDSSSYYYMQHSAAGKPAYLPEVQRWNCDTMCTYDLSNQIISRTKNTYNPDGTLAEYYTEYAVSQGWPYACRTVMTYNSNGKVTQKEVWLAATPKGQLEADSKETYSYNANNQLTGYVFYQGLSGGTGYVPMNRTKYTYSGGLLTEKFEERNSINGWEPSFRTTYTYPTATTIEETVETSNHSGWTISAKTVSVLDGSGRTLSSLREENWGGGLQPLVEHIYTYDANGNMLTHEKMVWRAGVKENFEKAEYTYNSDNNMLTSLLKKWDSTAYVVKEGSAATYNYYGFPTGVDDAPKLQEEIDIYPIPASNSLHINMAATGSYHAYLYDATGKLTKTVSATGLCTIDVQDLPAGNYVLQVNTNGNISSRKVVIAR